MHIRLANIDDTPALQSVFAACIAEAPWLPEQARQEQDFAAVSQGEKILLALAADQQLLGFISVQNDPPFIHHLFVRQEARGMGVGKNLLRALLPHLATPWQLKCVRANQQALAFYQSLGWFEVGAGESEQGAYALLQWPPLRT